MLKPEDQQGLSECSKSTSMDLAGHKLSRDSDSGNDEDRSSSNLSTSDQVSLCLPECKQSARAKKLRGKV